MGDPEPTAVNVGEEVTTTSTANMPLSAEAQFRNINQRLTNLDAQVNKIAAPPTFRVADVVNLLVIVIGLIIAGLTAFGLTERITDLNGGLTEAEKRVTAAMTGMELRLQSKLEKLSDQFISMDERTSRLEGGKAPERPLDNSPRVTKPNSN
jgi:hypothetical protein